MIRYFARHPTAANLLMLALILIGLTSLPKLKRETFPSLLPPLFSPMSFIPARALSK